MDRMEIRQAALKVKDRYSLLTLLNRLKEDDLGGKTYPFTIEQLNYFCHPARNAGHYVNFTIPKKSGGVREISAPTKILKSLLTYVNVMLQALYDPSPAAMGFVPGRSVVDNALRHIGMNYVFNLDLCDFFPSIPQARVWGVLRSKSIGFSENIASALAGLCCTEMFFYDGRPVLMTESLPEDAVFEKRCVLPQGSPASPILTNIVCQTLDRRLMGLAKRFGANYTRYADDITFSSPRNIYQEKEEFMAELRRIISDQNFQINEKKTRLQKRGARQEVTGLIVSDRVNVTRKYIRDLASLLFIWKQYGYDSAYGRFLQHYSRNGARKDIPSMERVVEGRLQYLKMVKGETDSSYLKLKLLFESLKQNVKEKIADINYIATYAMEAFEKQFDTKVYFFEREDRKNRHDSEKRYGAKCMIGGEEINLSVSRSSQKKITAAFGLGDETVDKLKDTLYVTHCQSKAGDKYWLVMSKRPQEVYASTVKRLPEPEKVTELHTPESILQKFVDSGFDLSIFDNLS